MDTANRRPELRARPAGAGDRSQRILSNLEHGAQATPAAIARRPTRWQLDGWTVALMAMLALLSVLVWMTRDGQITPRKYGHGSHGSSSAYGSHGGRHPAAAADAAVTEPAAAEKAATIINQAPTPAPATAEAAPPLRRAAAAPAVAAQAPASYTRPPLASAVTLAQALPAAAARKAPPAATAKADSAPADTDVALLSAMVEHAGKPAKAVTERSRDVIERQDGDSTAALLARCRQLGLIESLLCRSRICSGRWENEAACRAAH